MRENDNELVYVKVRPGRVVLERPEDAAPADRRRRTFAGGQRFITTRGRAKSLAVDIEGPVVAPADDVEPAPAEPEVATAEAVAAAADPAPAEQAASTDEPAAEAAAGDDAEDDGDEDGDEGEDAEQHPDKPRKRSKRGGHDRLYRGGHDRAV